GAVRVGDSLGRWLYGVSLKVAARARTQAARRRRLEAPDAAEAMAPVAGEELPGELRGILDEGPGRPPEKDPPPVVLCHLDGLTQEHAARVLGWPLGTVQGRLARARQLLKERLERRGLAPFGVVLALGGEGRPPAADVPPALVKATVGEASRMAAG